MIVSIVIPCHARLEHLKDCLPAVLAQTHKRIEVVVVDYACPEHCGDWTYSLDDQRLKVVSVSDVEWNASAARNAGIREATGEAVWLLDCDTQPAPEWLETNLPSLAAGTYVYSPGSILVTMDNLRNVGGFNELLVHGWGWEDVDLFNRLHATGLRRVDGQSVNPKPADCDWNARRRSLVANQCVSEFKGL